MKKATRLTIDLLKQKTQIAPQGLCSPPSHRPAIPLLQSPELLRAEPFSSSSSSFNLFERDTSSLSDKTAVDDGDDPQALHVDQDHL